MARVTRSFSKGQIDRAGTALISLPSEDPQRAKAIEIVDNWRSCHIAPLQIVKMTLIKRAKKVSPAALVAQRLKRRPSIHIKLRDNPNMKLSQMQDLGGCRAVMTNIRQVVRLAGRYRDSSRKMGSLGPVVDSCDDYIDKPKPDGYRGIHFIIRYYSSIDELKVFNGQRIEIQIRTKLQHAWATAVETAQLFSGHALKSKYKTTNSDWIRFFALASGAFALKEKCPSVPGVPEDRESLIRELRLVSNRLNALTVLEGWTKSIQVTHTQHANSNANWFIMRLDTLERTLRVIPYRNNEIARFRSEYELFEKEADTNPGVDVVLVLVDELKELRKAYPNYHVDTANFVAAIRKELDLRPRRSGISLPSTLRA
ncbi:MAG: RelA/SpoT domain-containing protein [Candidatus Hydrogenedentes bacterium]|nr:RelA/SpoT domain-containing protein [Candidatus Hydrogenedentota bacterium]